MIKAYAEIAAELGEDLSVEDITNAVEEFEADLQKQSKAVSAEIEELDDDEIENVAGGKDRPVCAERFNFKLCWLNDMCINCYNIYECSSGPSKR